MSVYRVPAPKDPPRRLSWFRRLYLGWRAKRWHGRMAREALWNALHEAERWDVLANTAFMSADEALREAYEVRRTFLRCPGAGDSRSPRGSEASAMSGGPLDVEIERCRNAALEQEQGLRTMRGESRAACACCPGCFHGDRWNRAAGRQERLLAWLRILLAKRGRAEDVELAESIRVGAWP